MAHSSSPNYVTTAVGSEPRVACVACNDRIKFALDIAQAVRGPVGNRIVGPHEAAAWEHIQVRADAELLEAVAASAACQQVAA